MTSKIRKALDEANKWMDYKGVEGIGRGQRDEKDCIIVFVSNPGSELYSKIPKEFRGFPVVFEESGQIDIQYDH